MQAIFVDINNELAEIEREVRMLESSLALYPKTDSPENPANWIFVQGIASGVENIYTGLERVMALVASKIDGERVDHTDGWHATLLRRLSNPFPEVRDAILSPDCYRLMNEIRAFRHRERNTYGMQLDLNLVKAKASQTVAAFSMFKADLTAFEDSATPETKVPGRR